MILRSVSHYVISMFSKNRQELPQNGVDKCQGVLELESD
jgi:hypothetical protein